MDCELHKTYPNTNGLPINLFAAYCYVVQKPAVDVLEQVYQQRSLIQRILSPNIGSLWYSGMRHMIVHQDIRHFRGIGGLAYALDGISVQYKGRASTAALYLLGTARNMECILHEILTEKDHFLIDQYRNEIDDTLVCTAKKNPGLLVSSVIANDVYSHLVSSARAHVQINEIWFENLNEKFGLRKGLGGKSTNK